MTDSSKETIFLSDDLIFFTVEGEGEFIGEPSVFMRLSMCNLTCNAFVSDDSPYGCDSYISWAIKNKKTFDEVFELMVTNKFVDHLRNGAIWKLTGGEPLVQQKQLLKLVAAFVEKFGFTPRIDFETNATIMPDDKWITNFNATFTTSPKLTTNGDPEYRTYKPDVLKWHVKHGSGFKFVINVAEDIDEIWRKYVVDQEGINIPKDRIWFMPCCGSRKEHVENAPAVVEYAKALDVKFSPRLQLLVWDKALSV